MQVCKLILLVFTLLLTNPAQADEWSLVINGRSVHLQEKSSDDFNEDNWGLGVQYDFDMTPKQWVPYFNAGGFKDSNEEPSYYAGGGTVRRFFLGKSEGSLHLDFGLSAFLMTRVDYKNGSPFFAAVPLVSFGTNRVALNATFVPEFGPIESPLLFFQLKIGVIGVK